MLKMNPIRWQALLAIGWIISGILTGLYGGKFHDAIIPRWGGWIIVISGVAILFFCLRAIYRGDDKVKKQSVTDEDIAKAKEELERMYRKEHGSLPEYPEESGEDEKREQKN